MLLDLTAGIFFGIALFVGAVVTANTFSAVVAGRTGTIALYRLLGASTRSQRVAFLREGALAGVIGSTIGVVAGTGLGAILLGLLTQWMGIPPTPFSAPPSVALSFLAGVGATTAAAWSGSRAVLAVSPLQALEAAQEPPYGASRSRVVRTVLGLVLVAAGVASIVLGIIQGTKDPNGVGYTFLGGVLSFSGLIASANLFVPRALVLVGKLFGSRPEARLARANALRSPDRSTRASIGIVIGVALVTLMSVGLATVREISASMVSVDASLGPLLSIVTAVGVSLVGFSIVIAAIGVISDLSVSVVQRRREIGLLRALGFTGQQVRRMILLEAAQSAITSLLLGLLLGVVYGWAGTQTVFSSVVPTGIVIPTIPPALIVALVIGTAALTLTAAVVPARRTTTIAPIDALQR
ncbi:ABC transporter permease [Clavibacter michiganensis]|uniref:ABC transporter permease n=1 Tax=Clavibacter michiganensis TaxID=28447 RepID=UPI0015E230D5|nr:ABC transporter permease [Clavibacter michiganensis]